MKQKYPIDTDWFVAQFSNRNLSQSDFARLLGYDRSAISRMLTGERNMSAQEQDKLAAFLGVSLEEVAAHRGAAHTGFAESAQSNYSSVEAPRKKALRADRDPYRHPVFGCMAGTLTIAPGVDLTEPMDFEWSGELGNE